MNPDDPGNGSDNDFTVIKKPNPGGGRRRSSAAQRRSKDNTHAVNQNSSTSVPVSSGGSKNRLLDAAGTLLALVGQLREPGTASHPDIKALRSQVERELMTFQEIALKQGVQKKDVATARYVLCALIDETVLDTWGSKCPWNQHTLLAQYHSQAKGGVEFFEKLSEMQETAALYIDLLELMYVSLLMGFRGKYTQDKDIRELKIKQANLFRTIQDKRGQHESDLSPHWHSKVDQRHPLVSYVPLWVLGAVLGSLLVMMFIGFYYSLRNATNPVFEQLSDMQRNPTMIADKTRPQLRPVPIVIEPEPTNEPDLRELLARDIEAGFLTIELDSNRNRPDPVYYYRLTLQGDGMFGSASKAIEDPYGDLLERIGRALKQVQGRIEVIGHTDDRSVSSWKFTNNWDLSMQRAGAVVERLVSITGAKTRFTTSGRADTEPLERRPNEKLKDYRARNRRVEIIVYKESGNP